jgi:hypothetical protein
MAKRKRNVTPEQIDQWLKESRGQGSREMYKPWMKIQDVSSNGTSVRRNGLIIQRQYNFMSRLEDDYFCCLEGLQLVPNSAVIIDIREQYPLLPFEETMAIAEMLNIKHPRDPQTQNDIVMTTDFLITELKDGVEVDFARTVKPSRELDKKRVIEKFEIERVYWEHRGVDWGIVTEHDTPKVFVKNVRDLRKYLVLDNISEVYLDVISTEILAEIHKTKLPINKFCLQIDARLGINNGTSLRIIKHLIANRKLPVNLFKPLSPTTPLNLVGN